MSDVRFLLEASDVRFGPGQRCCPAAVRWVSPRSTQPTGLPLRSLATRPILRHQLLEHLIDAEARRLLARRKLLETLEPLHQHRRRRILREEILEEPVIILEAFLAPLERVRAQIED